MKRLSALSATILVSSVAMAQGWPEKYNGVMLQGFSWDSYADTQWANLERQADEMSEYFSLIWVPNSGNCNSPFGLAYNKMGYTPLYYFDHNSSFGTEAQLRSMIAAFKAKGTGIIEDVVINHRDVLGQDGSWVDYPVEEYKGETWQMLPADIVANDDAGKTQEWASANGLSISNNNDTGEGWDGCRDLDHKSANVKSNIKAYLDFLLNDLGYAGFRYDMVKGFSAAYLGGYNNTVKPEFSVGEYWDNTSSILSWIKGTKMSGTIQSAAFDFPFRYTVRDAVRDKNWTRLANENLLTVENGDFRRYSVTFVENHDQQDRGNVTNYEKDPIAADYIPAANAYMLAMPGTPCVFLPHWKSCKQDIKQQILARKVAGIHNQSDYETIASTTGYYVVRTQGLQGELLCVVGKETEKFTDIPAGFTLIQSGKNYRYYLSSASEVTWISVPSGDYEEVQQIKLSAVSTSSDAKVVYTLDGSEPSANNGTVVASGTEIDVASATTLKVGLLKDNEVFSVETRHYTITPFVAHTATIYVKADFTPVYFYVWDSNNNTPVNGDWPGKEISATTQIDGETWYYQSFNIPSSGYFFNIIFNQGKDKPQTGDIGNISEDRYFIATLNGNTVNYEDVTAQHTSSLDKIESVKYSETVFDLLGQPAHQLKPGNLYISNGNKFMIK